jgi:hypothetical protein
MGLLPIKDSINSYMHFFNDVMDLTFFFLDM